MNEATNRMTRLGYCQFLLSSQINYTMEERRFIHQQV